MRKKFIAANWKMNTLPKEGIELANNINSFLTNYNLTKATKIVLAVPYTHLDSVVKAVDFTKIAIAAQNCSQHTEGAYTGEISALMIKSLGAQYVIVGHSERRQFFGDSDEIVALKLEQAHKNALVPIFCCGESLQERESDKHFEIVESQIKNAFSKLDRFNIMRTVIAYEPVWAIGTGKTASSEQAQEMHQFIRKIIANLYSIEIANEISILYGGSVNPKNANELFSCDDIDGGLIGGASLKANDFIEIIKSV